MGKDKLADAGIDDAGEMSSWYVFNAMRFYPFSPADEWKGYFIPLTEMKKGVQLTVSTGK